MIKGVGVNGANPSIRVIVVGILRKIPVKETSSLMPAISFVGFA